MTNEILAASNVSQAFNIYFSSIAKKIQNGIHPLNDIEGNQLYYQRENFRLSNYSIVSSSISSASQIAVTFSDSSSSNENLFSFCEISHDELKQI